MGRLGKIRARDKTCRRKVKCALRKARRQCTEAIERFDAFEAAMDTVRGALECVDVGSGELHRPEQVEALIAQAAGRIESLGMGECAKLARYLRNRAPGRVLAHKSVLPLSVRPQGRHPGLSRPVRCLVQSAHAALGTAQGDQRPPEPERTTGRRLAHAARLPALTNAELTAGRWRALTSWPAQPRALRASGPSRSHV